MIGSVIKRFVKSRLGAPDCSGINLANDATQQLSHQFVVSLFSEGFLIGAGVVLLGELCEDHQFPWIPILKYRDSANRKMAVAATRLKYLNEVAKRRQKTLLIGLNYYSTAAGGLLRTLHSFQVVHIDSSEAPRMSTRIPNTRFRAAPAALPILSRFLKLPEITVQWQLVHLGDANRAQSPRIGVGEGLQ